MVDLAMKKKTYKPKKENVEKLRIFLKKIDVNSLKKIERDGV